jgi:hypothetical protein
VIVQARQTYTNPVHLRAPCTPPYQPRESRKRGFEESGNNKGKGKGKGKWVRDF